MEIIERWKILNSYIEQLKNHETATAQKKACIWAIGQIGSSETGLELLLQHDIIELLVNIVESSDCLCLKGTSVYALGLISKTISGKQLLKKFNWQVHPEIGGIVCNPQDTQKMFSITQTEYKGDFTKNISEWKRLDELTKEFKLSEEKLKIIKLIGNLCYHLTQKNALAELKKISQNTPELLMDENLFFCVVLRMTYYSFNLQTRRYVFSLFDKLISSPNFLTNYTKVTEGKYSI